MARGAGSLARAAGTACLLEACLGGGRRSPGAALPNGELRLRADQLAQLGLLARCAGPLALAAGAAGARRRATGKGPRPPARVAENNGARRRA
eukprot:14005125-Heterocapsa_arctica.AAC.1